MAVTNDPKLNLNSPMISADRFIANRSTILLSNQRNISSQSMTINKNKEYRQLLKNELFKYLTPSPPSNILYNNVNNKVSPTMASMTCIKKSTQIYMSNLKIQQQQNHDSDNSLKPYFVLKIDKKHQIIDDFYSSILDWHYSSNSLVLGLKSDLFIYDLKNKCFSTKLNNNNNNNKNIISSVKINNIQNILINGRNNGDLSIYDMYKNKIIFNNNYNNSHIGCIENVGCEYILFGSKMNNNLNILDLRNNKKIIKTKLMTKSVSISMNPDKYRFAIGGRDHNISIYDIRYLLNRIYCLKYHKSSIRAISWNNNNYNIILSGGGNNDKKIAIWNLNNISQQNFIKYKSILIKKPISIINTKSQITNLYWLSNKNICSIHGYDENNINLWDTQKLKKYNDSSTYKINKRLLYSCFVNNNILITMSSDRMLRFWNLYNDTNNFTTLFSSSLKCPDIR